MPRLANIALLFQQGVIRHPPSVGQVEETALSIILNLRVSVAMQLPNFLPPLQWFPLPVFQRQKNYAGFAICALVNHLMQALRAWISPCN
jgi:hypothetical protein